MSGYSKLFQSIVTSTIWTEDDKTRIVWVTMLALADKHGEVEGSVPGLARVAGVAADDCRAALRKFLSPDPDSRTKDFEGRRIEEIEGGWVLLNYEKYRLMASKDDQKEKAAERQRRKRERSVTGGHGGVTVCGDKAEAEAEVEAKAKRKRTTSSSGPRWTLEGGWEGVGDDEMRVWGEAYPACDIGRQLSAMGVWLAANPLRAKKSNWRRFISSWLTRAQDRGGDVASGLFKPGVDVVREPDGWRDVYRSGFREEPPAEWCDVPEKRRVFVVQRIERRGE